MPVQRMSAVPPPETPPLERRRFLTRVAAAVAGLALLGRAKPAEASTQGLDPFIGEIMLFAGNFPPRNWAFCDGQLLQISSNTALFSLLGTTYGGNGTTNFALPDLRGRAPIHAGQGPGLSDYSLGQTAGEENHTLTIAEMPAHSHAAFGDAANGTSESPASALPAKNPAAIPAFGTTASASLASNHIGNTGSGQAHDNMPPYTVLSYCIALQGVFPPRN